MAVQETQNIFCLLCHVRGHGSALPCSYTFSVVKKFHISGEFAFLCSNMAVQETFFLFEGPRIIERIQRMYREYYSPQFLIHSFLLSYLKNSQYLRNFKFPENLLFSVATWQCKKPKIYSVCSAMFLDMAVLCHVPTHSLQLRNFTFPENLLFSGQCKKPFSYSKNQG